MATDQFIRQLHARRFEPIAFDDGSIYYPRAYFAIAAQTRGCSLFTIINKLPIKARNLFNHDISLLAKAADKLGRKLLIEPTHDTIVLTIQNGKAVTGRLVFDLQKGNWIQPPEEQAALLAYLVQQRKNAK